MLLDTIGFGPDVKPEEVSQALTELRTKISQPLKGPESASDDQTAAHVSYLTNSSRLLVTKGSQLKVFSRDDSQKLTSFNSFSNFAKQPDDTVSLYITQADLQFVLEKLDLSTIRRQICLQFLQAVSQTYDSSSFSLPYIKALQSINLISNLAFEKFKKFENLSAQI